MPKSRASKLIRQNLRTVKHLYPHVTPMQLATLREITGDLRLSLNRGELTILQGRWYVTHSGLLRIGTRRGCLGITTQLDPTVSNPAQGRWIFRATVAKTMSASFVGYGDADPSNVSANLRGSEMRIAETRAVNRALRKAYGIGIFSIEEIGSVTETSQSTNNSQKIPPQPATGNHAGAKVRDRLCQIIRNHELDANLVKCYATDFCGTKTLREASREQVENFVVHLADWAEKDRPGLMCQLNGYLGQKEGAA
jgi:hypothetical protein